MNESKANVLKALRANPEIAALPEDALELLASRARLVHFARGQTIFEEGQPSSEAWVMLKGKAVLGYHAASGAASATCIAGAGDLFCCLPILDGKNYPVTAVSEADSSVLSISADLFRDTLWKYPEVYQKVLHVMCSNLRSVECGHCHRIDRVPIRIMQTLIDLHAKHGPEILLTKWDVARLSGTTVETTIRTMAEMKRMGLIEGSKERIKIPDLEKLRVYLRGEKEFESGASDGELRKKSR
jgi:CRP-like cAMP-binding protein